MHRACYIIRLRGVVLVFVCFLAALAIRVPLRPHRLYQEDSVTLARAVDHYDPRHLFPQPPGYPLFILQSKIIRAIAGDVELAFSLGVVAATAVALYAAIQLAREISGALYAGLLLLINPVFLFTGMTSPIRVYLAAVSTLVALLCWRAWNGDSRSAWLAAIALGVGAGYRPELLALLAPLWAIATWRATRSWKQFLEPAILLMAVSACWFGFLLSQFPDLHAFRETFSKYAADQMSSTSLLFGAEETGWKRAVVRVAVWNGTAVIGWIALAPLAGVGFLKKTPAMFFAIWILPALAFHGLIHVEDPDHTLATIPAFCILGGAVLARFAARNRDVALLGIASAATVNLALFFAPFGLSPRPHWYKPATDALWQTAYPETMNVRARVDSILAALEPFAHDPHTLVLWNRSAATWRTLSYYYPDLTFCLLMDDRHAGTDPHAAFWRNIELRERYFGAPAMVPLGDAERLIWILGRASPIRASTAPFTPVAEGVWQSPALPGNVPGYRLIW